MILIQTYWYRKYAESIDKSDINFKFRNYMYDLDSGKLDCWSDRGTIDNKFIKLTRQDN